MAEDIKLSAEYLADTLDKVSSAVALQVELLADAHVALTAIRTELALLHASLIVLATHVGVELPEVDDVPPPAMQ